MKVRRVFLPGISSKQFIPVASLFTPRDIIIPMLFVSILAQLIDNFKYVLNPKEVLKIYSVKFYSNLIMFSPQSISLSVIFAIMKTLGYEMEIFSNLNYRERQYLLHNLKDSLMLNQKDLIDGKKAIFSGFDSSLLDSRRNYSLQFRSFLLSVPLYSSSSVVFGLPLSQITLEVILDSSRLIWSSLGLREEDFNFELIKTTLKELVVFKSSSFVYNKVDEINCIRMLAMLELKKFHTFSDCLCFDRDFAVLNSPDNIVNIERDLGFIKRNRLDIHSPLSL